MEKNINTAKSHNGKVVPSNLDAEKYILASLLLYNEVFDNLEEVKLEAEDFFDIRNQCIFKAMRELKSENLPLELVSITEKMRVNKTLESAGGAEYLSLLLDVQPTSAYAVHYAKVVKDKSTLRKLISISSEILNESYNNPENIKELVDCAEKKILDINDDVFSTKLFAVKDVVREAIKYAVDQSKHNGEISGIPSGFYDLDDMTDGFHNSELIIIAARPSVGKTAFALNILNNMALRNSKKVGFFSCEMPKLQLMLRMLCSEAEVDQQRLKKGTLPQQSLGQLAEVADHFYKSTIIFDDTPNIPIMELRSKARKMKREFGIECIMIDYLGLVSVGEEMSQLPRHEQVAFVSKSLKSLARELEIPIIALAQLNRLVESRGDDGVPRMSDLKDSGSIEQDADLIMFIHRKQSQLTENDGAQKADIRKIIVGKNRNGPIGDVDFIFLNQYTKFALKDKTSGEYFE